MKKLLFVLAIFYFFLLNFEFANAQVPSYVPTNGLVGYWPFNGNANDASGNGNNGVVNGATLSSDRNGNANSAYSFDGVSNYINVVNPSIINFSTGQSFSISFWLCADTTMSNTFAGLISKHALYNNQPYNGWQITRTRTALAYETNACVNQNLLPINHLVWKHYVYIFDRVANQLIIFENGIQATIKLCASLSTEIMTNPYDLKFGVERNNTSYTKGKLDDIAIYNRALSTQEITQLYTGQVIPSYVPTNGLVGYWPFNGNANDASGYGNNGTVNGATLTADRFGNLNTAYLFKNKTDFIDLTGKSIAGTGNAQRSIFVWVKTNDSTQYMRIISTGTSAVGQAFNIILMYNGVPVIMGYHPSDYLPNTGMHVADNQWHQIGVTYDGTFIKIYVDGILQNSSNQFLTTGLSPGGQISYNTTGNNNYFGAPNDPGLDNTYRFSGLLDDITIYNRSFTAIEVQNLYNSSSPSTCIANITNSDTTICKAATVTLNATAVNSASVTDINGNVYPTVNIGSQTWMQKNLNVSKYKNGDIIPQVTNGTQWSSLTTGAWCWYNNDSATYAATYGKLYNWYAVNDPRGLAPDGWHVPTQNEWNQTIQWIDNLADTNCINCSQSKSAGGSLKEVGISHWTTPNYGASNASGFTGLAAGGRNQLGSFYYFGINGVWWTSSSYSNNNAIDHYVIYDTTKEFTGAGYKVEGFSVRAIRNTPTYLWSNGATTPSITVSPLVTTTYYCTVSDGVNTCRDSVKITVGATAVPTAPLAITGATDVCSYIGADTASVAVNYKCNKVSTASSYLWSVPAGVTLLSGQGDTSINVRFSASFASGAITVKSINVCGTSTAARSLTVYKRVAATPALIQKEFSPTSIVAVTNVTGLVSETYRIKKVLYATSYNWSMNRGTNASITHINPLGVNDTAVIVTFFNCFVRDTLSVKSVTPCSVSTAKTAILYANTVPTTVAGIGTAGGDFSVCIGTTKTFNAISSTPTTTQAPIASYRWTTPANAVITSATSDSSSITVSFNTGFAGGSLTAKGVTACGVIGTTATTATLQYLPPTPLSISSSTNSYNACINSSVTYTAIVGAPTTSQAPAVVFRWTRPNNTTITSASADSSSITVRFNTGYIGGTLAVKGQTRCGTQGGSKSQSLTHTGCAAGTKMSVPVTTTINSNSFEVSLYPNPSAGEFKLLINLVGGKTATMATNLVGEKTPTKATVKVIDLQGRLIKSFECNANQVTALGNELKPGVYMVEVRMGNEVKTVRAVRF